MNAQRIALIAATSGCLGLAACAQDMIQPIGAPLLDSQFGEAVKKAYAMQVINPEGMKADDQGFSGRAAHSAMDRYDMSGPSSALRGGAPAADGNGRAAK